MQFINKNRKNKIVVAIVALMMTSSLGSSIALADTQDIVNNTKAEINSTQIENINSSDETVKDNQGKNELSDNNTQTENVSDENENSNSAETSNVSGEDRFNPENAKEDVEVEDFNIAVKKSSNFTGFVYEDGKWSFYQKGEIKKGWIDYNGVKYYILKDYRLPQNMWRMIKGYKYYFNKDGVMIRNQKININGQIYQFDKDGHEIPVNNSMKLGDVSQEQKKIYEKGELNLKSSVSNKKVGIIQEDGKWYKYVDGKKTRGWYQENGKTYFFLNTLNRAENMWRKIKGKLYYFGQGGVRYENGIKYVGSEAYKFNADGSLDENANPTFMLSNASLREKPDTSSKVLWNLKKNEGVNILQRSGNYAKVTTSDGSITGWIPGNTIISSRQERVNNVISVAKSKLGSPYVWGATGPTTFDCSGFTLYAFKNGAGITLPRVSKNQATVGRYVSREQLKPGDLIFWGNPIHHVAIYIGDGKYIHAPEPGNYVRIAKLGAYTTARRIIN